MRTKTQHGFLILDRHRQTGHDMQVQPRSTCYIKVNPGKLYITVPTILVFDDRS